MIEAQGLSKRFGAKTAVDNVTFTVQPGKVTGFLGPNGAGKSTLLKAMFGLVKVHSGTVVVRGQDITGLKANKLVSRGVGFVPQNNNVFPSLTIEENLQMGLYQQPKNFKERFEFVADLFPELKKRRAQRAGSLSGGERQMVAMGRALMMEPAVLLLDEPTKGIDVGAKYEIYCIIEELARAGKSIIMISSELPEVLGMSDRIMVVHEGHVTGIIDAATADQAKVMTLATGGSLV